jgi:ubiquinone/menaquinone biosynthesis C-methylase UbiE
MLADTQDRITSFWSSIASGYEAHDGNVSSYGTPAYDDWVACLAGVLPEPPSDVWDVATGTGYVALAAAALGHRVIGIDLSDSMLSVARWSASSRGVGASFLLGDAVAPMFPPFSFDVITNRHLLWTLRKPELAFHNWRSLLRPGGRLVCMDGLWFSEPTPRPVFDDYYTPATRADLPFMEIDSVEPIVSLLTRCGFSSVSVSGEPSSFLVVARR